MTQLILGVDGGQTSTAALLASADGAILGVGYGGPANHIHEPGGMERMQRSLHDAVHAAFAQVGIASVAVESACFGMTGGAEIVPQMASAFLQAGTLSAYHDVVTALAGASIAEPEIVVIAGTGAIAYGRGTDGREAQADGWGYLMGDEGSGYDIGLKVLRAAGRAQDGRGDETLLREYAAKFLGKADLKGVRAALYNSEITRAQIAGLSWVASCAAERGDAAAREILADAGRSLAQSATAVISALDDPTPAVYPTGGVFRAGAWVLTPFEAGVRRLAPNAEIRTPAFPQVVGALLLAHQAVGAIDEPFLTRLRATLPPSLMNKSAAANCGDFPG